MSWEKILKREQPPQHILDKAREENIDINSIVRSEGEMNDRMAWYWLGEGWIGYPRTSQLPVTLERVKWTDRDYPKKNIIIPPSPSNR